MSGEWFFPRDALRDGAWESVVDDKVSDWRYTGLRIANLEAGTVELSATAVERIVVPLNGAFSVTFRDAESATLGTQKLNGRESVFSGPTDVLYLPTGTSAAITGSGRVAVAEAPSVAPRPVAYIPVGQVPVELRGAGRSSRQVHNFGTPGVLDADRLIVC